MPKNIPPPKQTAQTSQTTQHPNTAKPNLSSSNPSSSHVNNNANSVTSHTQQLMAQQLVTQELATQELIAQQQVLTCAQQATREINILSHALPHNLYGQSELLKELSRIARRHRTTQVRILIENPRSLYGKQHPVITLSQKLPSYVKIRVLNKEQHNSHAHCCIADNHSLVLFTNESQYKAQWLNNSRAKAHRALECFSHYWLNHSHEDPELKSLSV